MSVATVKAHVTRLLTKLELNNRVQIALLAHDAGLAWAQRHATPVH
jgi:DNA-binding NarL/FixJ family response regulator